MLKTRVSKIDLKAHEFVSHLIGGKFLNRRVRETRIKYSIPIEGLDLSIFDKLVLSEKTPRIPNFVDKKIKAEIYVILSECCLSSDWYSFLLDYVLFNWVGDFDNKRQIIVYELGDKSNDTDEVVRFIKETKDKRTSPILIALPQSFTIRELEDFFNKNQKLFRKVQSKYVSPLSFKLKRTKKKNKNISERDEFIYQNRRMEKLELMSLVKEKYGQLLDYTYLNRIIKHESRKKRDGILN